MASLNDEEARAQAVREGIESLAIVRQHLLALLNEGLDLIERGNRYIEAEPGEDGFVTAYRWPKVGSWHRILGWHSKVASQLVMLGERRAAAPAEAGEEGQ
jgi:hypothetical protein